MGPEIPPPEDAQQLRDLKINYWYRLQKIITAEVSSLVHKLEALKQLQDARGGQLWYVGIGSKEDPVTGATLDVPTPMPLDLDANPITGRKAWLQEILNETNTELAALIPSE